MAERVLWLVLMMRQWSDVEIEVVSSLPMPHLPATCPLPPDMPGLGFMPVFGTREEAEAFAEGRYAVRAIGADA